MEWAHLEPLQTQQCQALPHGMAVAEVWEILATECRVLLKVVEPLDCSLIRAVLRVWQGLP